MSERPGNENRETGADEPLYTRAEVDNMINEMLAAKLAELETVFPTPAPIPIPSFTSRKGKEPEIFVPWEREQDILYHKELLENSKPVEEVFSVSYAFLKQFTPEARKTISMDELKAVTQNLNEPFSDYLNRWWNKLMLVRNKPDEQGLIRVFLSGTLPTFRKEMYFLPYDDFMDVRQVGMDIERHIWLEALQVENDDDQSGPALKTRRTSGPQTSVKPSGKFQGQGGSRQFTNLGMSLSRMMEKLIKKGLLQRLEPRPLPDPVPGYFDLQCYCDFHQSKGHHTNGCKRLRHEIQDLIDQGKVRDPSTGRVRNPK